MNFPWKVFLGFPCLFLLFCKDISLLVVCRRALYKSMIASQGPVGQEEVGDMRVVLREVCSATRPLS